VNKSDEERFAPIDAKLDTLIRLFALIVAPEKDSLKDRAIRLQRAGLSPKDIAALCDTTPNTVSVILSTAKREKRGKRARKSGRPRTED